MPIERDVKMLNDYELRYSHVTGTASDLYREFKYGWVGSFDFVKLIDILENNNMDDEADEIRDELKDIIMYDGEVSED